MRNKHHSCIFPIFLSTLVIFQSISVSKSNPKDSIWPEDTGTDVITDESLAVNISNIDEGYVIAKTDEDNTEKKKIRISKDGQELYYDIEGNEAVIPVNMGRGTYKIELYENIDSNKYKNDGELYFETQEENEENAFLCPNEFVDYSKDSLCVTCADVLCEDLSKEEAVEKIEDFIEREFVYDFVKAVTIEKDVFVAPDINGCFTERKGICQDLSCMAAAMFRSQGVPCKVVVGEADGLTHAWNEIIMDEQEILYDPTVELTGKKVRKYMEERIY